MIAGDSQACLRVRDRHEELSHVECSQRQSQPQHQRMRGCHHLKPRISACEDYTEVSVEIKISTGARDSLHAGCNNGSFCLISAWELSSPYGHMSSQDAELQRMRRYHHLQRRPGTLRGKWSCTAECTYGGFCQHQRLRGRHHLMQHQRM